MSRPGRGAAGLLAFALLVAWRGACAQGSPYVPLDDPAYGYIDALTARGLLTRLPALERPYTARQIRSAVGRTVPPASGVVASWLRALDEGLRRYEPADIGMPAAVLDVTATAGLLGTAQSSARRELMVADATSGAYPGVWGRVLARAGPAVAGWRVVGDKRLKPDPEFTGSKKRSIAGRVEDAYLAGQWRLGELFVGRQARNWGPPALVGLQLGSYAYSYDQLSGRLGPDALHLSTLLARLDDLGVPGDSLFQRYLALHRVAGRWRRLEVGVSEAVLYGGVGRGFELAYANPLNVFMLSQYNEGKAGNINYAFDAAYQSRGRGIYAAQLLWDDFQIDSCDPQCLEPPSYGLSLTAEGVPLVGAQRAFASYTRVSNLAYRTPVPLETYSAFGVGIGRGFSDYDEARVGLDLAVLPKATTRVYAALRRQGEGDYRLRYPTPDEYADTPELLAGVVTRTTRLAVQTTGRPRAFVAMSADLGVNRVSNAGHVVGRRRTSFEARLQLSIEPSRPFRLRLDADGGHIPSAGP